MRTDLFSTDETPFNLAGESLEGGLTVEGEMHVREVARIECDRAQLRLSKWWTTPSAQAAFERAKRMRQERISKMRSELQERKNKQQTEIDQ